jgi:3-methyladenine DNA glycosylase AlkC
MKTTLNIHDNLLAEAKALAARQRLSLTRLIEEGLRMRLRSQDAVPAAKRRPMPVFRGKSGLAAGLSGLSTREMLDAAD